MYLVFDTEAKDIMPDFRDNGVSYVGVFRSDEGVLKGYFEDQLNNFLQDLQDANEIVGYNILGYDIPVLDRYFSFDWNSKKLVDIFMILVEEHGLYLKLDNIAHATLGEGKNAHGLEAVRFYKLGQLEKLKEYCDNDVDITRRIYEFLVSNNCLYYFDGLGEKIRVDLNLNEYFKKKSNNSSKSNPDIEDAGGNGLF
ncbi:MAG: ribonuclease H-like domain-containing protein [Candidatus Dojkabacteria bacterium]|nr:ribonuclease H-like domain-containing protein [Candidatus Dojkabacteria bacterium]